jgi:hypothetical protein
MCKKLYIAAFLLAACGAQPRSLDEIDTDTTKPTGTVDAISASSIVLDHSAKDALFEAVAAKNSRLPTGFIVTPNTLWLPRLDSAQDMTPAGQVPDFFSNACTGVSRDGKETSETLDMSTIGLSGTLIVAVSCNDQHGFTMNVTMNAACSKTACFDGGAHYQLAAGKLVWSLRGTVKPTGGTSRDVDIAGVAVVGGTPADLKLVGFYKAAGKDGKPTGDGKPVILTWGGPGVGQFSEYYLTGADGLYRCNTIDIGVSGCCRHLDASNNPTGDPITWGGKMCG